jgi:hypothetical protein
MGALSGICLEDLLDSAPDPDTNYKATSICRIAYVFARVIIMFRPSLSDGHAASPTIALS